MAIFLVISAVSAGSVAFLIYFEFALWRDERQQGGRQVFVLKLRETIARKRHQPRALYMHKLETARLPGRERARDL